MDMDAKKLAEVRRVLGARTDTEAVDQALDLVLFQHEVSSALDRLAEAGGIYDINELPPDTAGPNSGRRSSRRRGSPR
jgi:hypothetical protein